MTTVRALTPIKHDGIEYLPADDLDVSVSQAKRLIELGAAGPIDVDQPDAENDSNAQAEPGVETASDPNIESGVHADSDPTLNVSEPPPPADPEAIDSKPFGRKLFGKKGK